MYWIRSECSFDSAHFLKGYKGKCRNLHGHRWRVVAELKAEALSEGHVKGNQQISHKNAPFLAAS